MRRLTFLASRLAVSACPVWHAVSRLACTRRHAPSTRALLAPDAYRGGGRLRCASTFQTTEPHAYANSFSLVRSGDRGLADRTFEQTTTAPRRLASLPVRTTS